MTNVKTTNKKTPETLVEDIYDLFRLPHTPLDQNVNAFLTAVGNILRQRLAENNSEERLSTPKLYMSNLGWPLRKLWYHLKTPPKAQPPVSPSDAIKFLYGSILEEFLLFLTVEAGHTISDMQRRVTLDGVSGKMDARIDGRVVEIKSASEAGFFKYSSEKVKSGTPYDDPFGNTWQLSAYLRSLLETEGGILALNKSTGELKYINYDKWDIKDVSARIAEIRKALESDTPPPKCYPDRPAKKGSTHRVIDGNCAYCPFKFTCWADANGGEGLKAYKYANGTRYFSYVDDTRPIRVEEVNLEEAQEETS